ncbi:MAG: rRNA maturation RNase YbeY [Actinomycetota bacterium]|nr:rRNA maturation RNase YbeY [Actinomycetota bacterium]
MAVDVFVADEQNDAPIDIEVWRRLVEDVVAAAGPRGDVELALLFVDAASIASLNEKYLDRQGPTDVLAFPVEDVPAMGGRDPDSGGPAPGRSGEVADRAVPVLLGDVFICPEVAGRNAAAHGRGLEDELALLAVHGVLHLFGMDHEQDEDATQMEAMERDLLARFYEVDR